MKVRRIAECVLLVADGFSVSSAGAAQSAQAGDQQSLAAIRTACAEDAQTLCVRVQPLRSRLVERIETNPS